MNLFESTFEKHKKLVIEAIATNKTMSDDELALKGGEDKATQKVNAAGEKKSRGWEDASSEKKDSDEKISKFNPTEFWENFKTMPVSQFVAQYKNIFTDPKIKAFINSGKADGDSDEAFSVEKETLPVKQLVPTQNEIGFGNSVDDLCKKTFNLEKQLEDFLVSNWDRTPLAKEYEIFEEKGQRCGQQYRTNTGPIDILGQRKDKSDFLVVELKRDRASDVVVGQTLRYMGWVKEHLCNSSQRVTGCIIAQRKDEKLDYALKHVDSIRFLKYEVDFRLLS